MFNVVASDKLAAYRPMYNCSNVVTRCVEDWKYAMDNNEVVGCVIMDLSKAFESLPHGLLIAKLMAYGLSVHSASFILSYLRDRPQCVRVGSSVSSFKVIRRGVPQGSVLGPLLFNFFINDLIMYLQSCCDVYNYADDNTLSYHHVNPSVVKNVLQGCTNFSVNWFDSNNMKANSKKFQCMILSRSGNLPDITFTFGNTVLHPLSEVKILGVVLDQKLSFESHLNNLCRKVASKVNSMFRLTKILNVSSKLKLYNAFIMSHLNFCSTIYHFCSVTKCRKLERLNERALRIVYNNYQLSYRELLKFSNQRTLYVKREIAILEQVYKILYNLAPPMNDKYFTVINSNYSLRNSKTLTQRKCNTYDYGMRSLLYAGSKIWNDAPSSLKLSNTFADFVNSLSGNLSFLNCDCNSCLKCSLLV